MASRKDSRPVTDEDRQAIADLVAQGVSRNEIARRLNRPAATITKYAPKGAFDRTATKAATEARKVDLAARRATAAEREMQILEKLQDQMLDTLVDDKPFLKVMRAGMGAEEVRSIAFIPGEDAQRLANARSSSTTIIERLTRDDSTDEAAKSLLVGLAGAFGLTAPDDDGT